MYEPKKPKLDSNNDEVCQQCGSNNMIVDHKMGVVSCGECGRVTEGQMVVNEIQFMESGGKQIALGAFVPENDRPGFYFIEYCVTSDGKISTGRGYTIYTAKKQIEHIASQLCITQDCQNMALNFYKLLLSRSLTRRRIRVCVLASCLYISSRLDGLSFMLLDFSDVIGVDVYKLGRIYLFQIKSLSIKLPSLDPCLYVHRFASQMELGNMTHTVIKMTNSIVSRMKRDWMAEGRRPSGICAAALLVAARMYNFNRTIKQVVKIARIGASTLKHRLEELGNTASAKLTIDEFQSTDLEAELYPPCANKGPSSIKEKDFDKIEEEINSLQSKIDSRLFRLTKKSIEADLEGLNVINNIDNISKHVEPEAKTNESSTLGNATEMCLKLFEDDKITQIPNLKPNKSESDDSIDLENISDGEIDSFICNQKEIKENTTNWDVNYRDFEIQEKKKLEMKNSGSDNKRKDRKKIKSKLSDQRFSVDQIIESFINNPKMEPSDFDGLKDLDKM